MVFFAMRAKGLDVDWMLDAKPFLSVCAVMAFVGYIIHLRGHEITFPKTLLTARNVSVGAISAAIVLLVAEQ